MSKKQSDNVSALTHKGTQVMQTERLTLRPIKADDYKDMYKFTSKEEVAKYVSWSVHKSIDDTKALCEMWAGEYKNGDRYNWAIVYNNTVIGNIDVVKIVGTTAFLGWQIDSDYWNKGIVTEAALAVRDYLFSQIGITAIEATHIDRNIGSGRVMQKIGMSRIPDDEFENSLYFKIRGTREIDGMPLISYILTKEEWEKL